jgi:methylenetetrahydrofolate dehydrogenase (NADP+)/methenyltetrahydrofolate cyclohydrolase
MDQRAAGRIIAGKASAARLRARIAAEVAQLRDNRELVPGLAVVLVGRDPASEVYVRAKHRQTVEAGMNSFEHRLPDTTTEAELFALIHRLNADPAVHGILLQLPLLWIGVPTDPT